MARKILLADDSVTAQNMGRRILIDAGYEVITVNNGSAALKKIAEQKPDLIILDVYMPGYGGLELCQRLREGRDTARTPILLTVGKLEPFKADEARRVRADAYIVKPFEATELLTALTKLEDKIVPGPEPYKPGRFAKAFAAIDQAIDPAAEGTGGDEGSWKDRLRIPGGPKLVEQSNGGKGSRGRKEKEAKTSRQPETANVPSDITAEEMSAIAAAAAALNADNTSEVHSEAKSDQQAGTSAPPVTEIPAEPPAVEPVTIARAAEAPAPIIEPEPAAPEVVAQIEQPKEQPQSEASAQAEQPATEPAAEEPRPEKATDAEVLAALATLGVNDDSAALVPAAAQVIAAAAVSTRARGPRWIAEEITVSDDEGTSILEHEMEKAYAALAAAEGNTTFATFAVDPISANSTAVDTNSQTESLATPAEEKAEPSPEPPQDIATAAHATVSWVDNTVQPGLQPAETAQQEPAAVAETKAEAVMAVAAGAETIGPEPVAKHSSEPTASVPSDSVHSEGQPRTEADLAAAWANWKQIRETVMGQSADPDGSQPTAKETEVPQSGGGITKHDSASSTPADSEALASIVDNMLAELKPKLMEELARKLAKEKSGAEK